MQTWYQGDDYMEEKDLNYGDDNDDNDCDDDDDDRWLAGKKVEKEVCPIFHNSTSPHSLTLLQEDLLAQICRGLHLMTRPYLYLYVFIISLSKPFLVTTCIKVV